MLFDISGIKTISRASIAANCVHCTIQNLIYYFNMAGFFPGSSPIDETNVTRFGRRSRYSTPNFQYCSTEITLIAVKWNRFTLTCEFSTV